MMDPRREDPTQRAVMRIVVPALLWLALFAWPFLTASLACDRRLNLYALAGLTVLVLGSARPFIVWKDRRWATRAWVALAFALATIGVWIAGMMAGEVRIMCRLF